MIPSLRILGSSGPFLPTEDAHRDILDKTRSRMTMSTTFSRQNDAGSRAHTTCYWKSLVLVVVPDDPDLESKRHNTTDCYFVVSGFIDVTVT